ncbi:Glyoxylase, beta-lactamase superfamily II [Abditibacterium utsteinense]|uniref:Glyoxylase, beta-lactamase superfamily II n=1 Tax=Abditibacterium utsteinense TaxID=1960156 RepID=A0A2S8SR32_9BACT|nr:MBL fold metallo-hydrolase [Abditibacterium utsteinense]PQV63250.1 Glyoxylase, beta-lactamase superfamily II [Abditibacterium utsteinense]
MKLSSSPLSPSSKFLQIESFVCGPLQTNSFLLIDENTRQAVIIDPSIQSDAAFLRATQLRARGIELKEIWNTHGHFDHIYDNARWKAEFRAPVLASQNDEFFLENLSEQSIWFGLPAPEVTKTDHFLQPDEILSLGEFSCRVLTLPGHSPGSVGFYFEALDLCIQGDVLFAGSVGRTDLPGCSEEDLAASLQTLFALPPQTQILTGHGEFTTIEIEKRENQLARALIERYSVQR